MKTNVSVVIEQARYPPMPVGSCQVLSLSHQKSRHQNRKHRPRLLHPVRAMTSLDFIYRLAQPLAARATLEQQHGVAPISLESAVICPPHCCFRRRCIHICPFRWPGTNEVYFDELQTLYDLCKPYISPLITAITNEILVPLAASHVTSSYYNYGMDVASWLSGSVPRPSTMYLVSILLPSHWINSAHSVPCCLQGGGFGSWRAPRPT